MQERKSGYDEKFSVDIVKMIRNNNIVIGSDTDDSDRDGMARYNTYFMLDYFDLLFHRNLVGDEKIYREFWNIRDKQDREIFSYKAAYKTLSLYADKKRVDKNLFKVEGDIENACLSSRPFLGIVQVDFVYHAYNKEPLAEKVLLKCEMQILSCLKQNGFSGEGEARYQIHRSSTSGDFCLVVKSASIQAIYKISSLIDNLKFSYDEETYGFSTYTNIGIECFKDEEGYFYTFHKDTVDKNKKCRFALRITTRNQFAGILFRNIQEEGEMSVVIEPMEGLFGRYDFLIMLSMEEFSKLYATLCESKIIGNRTAFISEPEDRFLDSFQKGVMSGDIEVINERVLVSLEDDVLDLACTGNKHFWVKERDSLRDIVKKKNKYLRRRVEEFQQMISLFVEERRAFIDVSRELGEVISTYAPQGVEYDSHVNWQILVSDLTVTFASIDAWKKAYEAETDPAERKEMREQFIAELRQVTEALNQYYKFLQNVNAQTWQAPLYEIQTQLDAEKMMIAYREFLYQYLQRYRKFYKDTEDKRPMRYPIVYPDLSAEKVYVTVAFQNERDLYKQLFVCKVPSFEYYGRMFDMIPWCLHEASHCIRVLLRETRNEYIIKAVFREVFSHAFYKLLNNYSNDYGYHTLGELENDVVDCIVISAVTEFNSFCCSQGMEKVGELAINHLEMELMEFLQIIFEQDISRLKREDDIANVEEIKKALLRFLGKAGLLDAGERGNGAKSWKDMVEHSVNRADVLFELFKEIYQAFYRQMTGSVPEENEWKVVISRDADFEEKLKKVSGTLDKPEYGGAMSRDYCFSIRELNRLYSAWYKRRKKEDKEAIRDKLWSSCIAKIRNIVKEGFRKNQGFPELYRILNMIFDNGEESEQDVIKRIGKEFDRLIHQEIFDLTERTVTLYRESAADIFMTEALKLDAFGYCRCMFQTASDASIEDSVNWAEAINVHRFRSVAAVLLSHELDVDVRISGKKKIISMKKLLTEGEKFCRFTLDCAEEKIYAELKNKCQEWKKASIQKLFGQLGQSITVAFSNLTIPTVVMRKGLEYSALALLIDPKRFDEPCDEEMAVKRKRVRDVYEEVKDEVQKFVHIFFRIKCFISLLELVGEKGNIVIEEDEYNHLDLIYQRYGEVCKETQNEEICRVISEYYNTPQSAKDKSSAEMLEDTLQFIQTYYYKNRFNIMSSLKEHRREERDVETSCS